jgi:hypothetical protein
MSGYHVWKQIIHGQGNHSRYCCAMSAVGEVVGVDLSRIDSGHQNGLCYRKSFGMKLENSEIGHAKQKV